MIKTFIGSFVLLVALPAVAFVAKDTEISKTYEVTKLEQAPEIEQVYVGNLDSYPMMYEVSSDTTFDLSAEIWQRYQRGSEPIQFSLIAVRVNEGDTGVTEVKRLNPEPEDWIIYKDKRLGMTFWIAPVMETEVKAGTYRVEISTPRNEGDFMLVFGEEDNRTGYFETIGSIRTVQANFGYGIFRMLLSSYVYYALGILILMIVFYKTWQYRKLISNGFN